MDRYETQNKVVLHTVVKYDYTVTQQKEFLVDLVKQSSKSDFNSIFGICENRIHAIFTFLALLELLQLQVLGIIPGEGHNNFWITVRNNNES